MKKYSLFLLIVSLISVCCVACQSEEKKEEKKEEKPKTKTKTIKVANNREVQVVAADDTLSYALGVDMGSELLVHIRSSYPVDSIHQEYIVTSIEQNADMSTDGPEMAQMVGVALGLNFDDEIKKINDVLKTYKAKDSLELSAFLQWFAQAVEGNDLGMDVMQADEFMRKNLQSEKQIAKINAATCEKMEKAMAIVYADEFDTKLIDQYHVNLIHKAEVMKALPTVLSFADAKEEMTCIGKALCVQLLAGIIPSVKAEFFENPASFNMRNFYAGFYGAIKGEDLWINVEESKAIRDKVVAKKYEAQQKEFEAQFKAACDETKAAGLAFLEENKKKEGVKVTPSGLQYLVIKEGKGAKPSATDKVKVHYEGTLIDGTIFDSSIKRGTPAEFPLNQVIAGWTEGLQLMSKGAKYRFFIPYELAYGEGGTQSIMPYSVLIFDVELLDIVK
jgi:FKBP-type peptidyl-prolyl cis-trans isomerase FklB